MMTPENRAATMKRLREVKARMKNEVGEMAIMQLVLVEAYQKESPADELCRLFGKGMAGRDAAAGRLLDMAMSGAAMFALDLIQEEQARMN